MYFENNSEYISEMTYDYTCTGVNLICHPYVCRLKSTIIAKVVRTLNCRRFFFFLKSNTRLTNKLK